MVRKNMVDSVIAERTILSSLHNPFVVKLYYAFQCEVSCIAFCIATQYALQNYLYLVMEYCIGGDVASLLRNIGPFEEEMARVYAAETVLALECLHSMGYIHRLLV